MSISQSLIEEVQEKHPSFPVEPLKRAFELANRSHGEQKRRSGEPYIIHPVEVVRILLQMRVDLPSLIAGLLHDTVEDTFLSLEEIEQSFGKEVSFLVDGVTKLSKLSFRSKHTAQAENFRKMIMAMGRDVRVILIKLADRLHNMRTLQHMPPTKQQEIASETEEVYAPLAHRLGINWVKTELQDLSLRYLKPDVYFKLVELVAQSRAGREKYIQEISKVTSERLDEAGFGQYEIQGRPKHFYSIYKKMEKAQLTFEEIHDLLAVRIVCEDIRSCYQSLGILHSMWKPVPGRFKDYIAMPKANLYQSLHTTVIGPGGQRVEFQIRTFEMHRIAEEGIAAHWTYKEDGSVVAKDAEKFSWIRKLVEDQEAVEDPSEFMSSLKIDLFEEEVFVFTPRGDVISLPRKSCPVDFAYSIHSAVGERCVGAKVNGRLVPLRHQLESGDHIEIITSESQFPRKDWLDFCVTSKARSKIRAYVKKAQRDQSKDLGLKLLDREFRKSKFNFSRLVKEEREKFEEAVRSIGAANEEDLLIKVGYGKITAEEAFKAVMKSLHPEGAEAETASQEQDLVAATKFKTKSGPDSSPIIVDGVDNILVRFARCCQPIPGEAIVGFVSRGKGISVHRADCSKALELDPARKFDLTWDPKKGQDFPVSIKVTTMDRPGMLADISQVISAQGANISNARVQLLPNQRASIIFDLKIQNLSQVRLLISKIEAIEGVIHAERH
ncbi:MAG: bifunctional (p)ppGpp synthetase/guanosine-3',5'-bis(diphosphate) 3'-pyrophosphohydrolase [Bradymonadales bacterium]|nr:MAG: bifunctional (p)ppGpp synthetase/guanosine-3',5'-bis(diphosphate) 3'-pyrophosphohydrolase [Bradymonadales bacterium]